MLSLVTSSAPKVPLPYAGLANICWIFGQPAGSVQRRQEKCLQTGYYGVMSRLLPAFIYCHCIKTIGATRQRLTLWNITSTTTFIGINRNLCATFCFSIIQNKPWLFCIHWAVSSKYMTLSNNEVVIQNYSFFKICWYITLSILICWHIQ